MIKTQIVIAQTHASDRNDAEQAFAKAFEELPNQERPTVTIVGRASEAQTVLQQLLTRPSILGGAKAEEILLVTGAFFHDGEPWTGEDLAAGASRYGIEVWMWSTEPPRVRPPSITRIVYKSAGSALRLARESIAYCCDLSGG